MSLPPGPDRRVINRIVGLRLRVCRVWAGLSEQELANRLGVSLRQIRRYEKGITAIGARELHGVARILRVPASIFFPEPARDPSRPAAAPPGSSNEEDFLFSRNALEIMRLIYRMSPEDRDAFVTLLRTVTARTQDPGSGPGDGEEGGGSESES